jgi:hypothetical protein
MALELPQETKGIDLYPNNQPSPNPIQLSKNE